VLDLVLNGQRLDLCFSKGYLQQHATAGASVLLNVTDSSNQHHAVNVTADARSPSEQDPDQDHDLYPTDIILRVVSVDDTLLTPPTEVSAQLDVLPEKRLRTLIYHPSPRLISFDKLTKSFTNFRQPLRNMAKFDKDDLFDIEDELEVLRMLEADAVALKAELDVRKLVVNQRLQKQLANIPLKELVEHCDGIMCAAKIVAGRLCDKMGMANDSPPDYSEIDTHLQYMLTPGGEKSSQQSKEITGGDMSSDNNEIPQSRPSTVAGQSITSATTPPVGTLEGRPRFVGKKSLHNPLVIALEILAGILGLTALCAFIHKKCMSMRTRVERAADKEERRNARAYRRAARRALIRKRWNNFVTSVFCFGGTKEPMPRDYDEKRALILQDAFLEQDIDLAEKGEVMEAQIRELRNAHDIVAGLIGVDEHRFDLARHNPPPHAYFPATLSRRSTGTLPSYTAESLPDYTSTPDTSDGSGRVADGFTDYTPATSNSGARFSAAPTNSTRYTPVSSVVAISPRCSSETLRTRHSGDS